MNDIATASSSYSIAIMYKTKLFLSLSSYSIICKCWKHSPDDRPFFNELSSCLEAKLHSVCDYMEIEMVLDQGT